MCARPLDDAAESDAELIERLRGGDLEAHGALFARHHSAAVRVATKLTRGTRISADDAAAEAFLRTLDAIGAGKGPRESYRAYLYTVMRNYVADTAVRDSRSLTVDDFETVDVPVSAPRVHPAVTAFESDVVRRAYASIPERWQAVLWYCEVEGMKPAAVAPLLGLTANGTSALLFRAREGLRQAYLVAHLAEADPATECATISPMLGAYERGKLARRDRAKVKTHVESCADCAGMVAEVHEVNRGLVAVVLPGLLGGAGAAAFASEPGGGGQASASEMAGSHGAVTVTAGAGLGVSTAVVAGLASVAVAAAVASPLLLGAPGEPEESAALARPTTQPEPRPFTPRTPAAEPIPEPPSTQPPAPDVRTEQDEVPVGQRWAHGTSEPAPEQEQVAPSTPVSEQPPGQVVPSTPVSEQPPLSMAWGSHTAGAVGKLITWSRGWVWVASTPDDAASAPATITIELGDSVTGTGEIIADGADCIVGEVVSCTIQPVPAGHVSTVLLGVDVLAAPATTVPVTVTEAGGSGDPVVVGLPVAEAGPIASHVSFTGFRASTASSADPALDIVGAVHSAELLITGTTDTWLPPQALQYAGFLAPDGALTLLSGGSTATIEVPGGPPAFMTAFDVADFVGAHGSGDWHAWSPAPNTSWVLRVVSEDDQAGGLIELAGSIQVDPGAEVRVPLPTLPESATVHAYAVGAGGPVLLGAQVVDGELVITGDADGAVVERVTVEW